MAEFTRFFEGYCAAAVWYGVVELEDNAEAPEAEVEDLSEAAKRDMAKDAWDFWKANYDLLADFDQDVAGHDFWWARNGHGTGYFDGDYGEHGDTLQEAASAYGESHLGRRKGSCLEVF